MSKNTPVPIIYNLFPRYFKNIDEWNTQIPHVAEMGFNWMYVNPFHSTGSSGSLYAIKNYYELNPLFLRKGQDSADWKLLQKFVVSCNNAGLGVMMDLVINHTAFDSVLVKTNPQWYKRDNQGNLIHPGAIDPGNPGNSTVWGDLAEIDNENSSDRKNLWSYWDKLIALFQNMGIYGFRCDAAYQVSAELWSMLIKQAIKRNPQTVFCAETLGCRLDQVEALSSCGFHYLFNSSKWWNYEASWCLDQQSQFKHIAPSISFPENHDTTRLAAEHPGTIQNQKGRYLFAAIFSESVMMLQDYEYGAKIKTDVVNGAPCNLEKPQWDISGFIKEVNALKQNYGVLKQEGSWNVLGDFNAPTLFLEKHSNDNRETILVIINRSKEQTCFLVRDNYQWATQNYQKMVRPFTSIIECTIPDRIEVEPAEVVLFIK